MTARSLAGKRIVITRPGAQAQQFVTMLRQAGAVLIIFPTIQIEPIPNNVQLVTALDQLSGYDWVVFTSVNGVNIVLDQLGDVAQLNRSKIAVIGPATANALREQGVRVDLQPDEYVAEGLADALIARENVQGLRFLLLRADIARPTLREQLVAHRALVDEIPVYRTVRGQPDPAAYAELRAGVDVITFTSSSTVRYFFDLLGDEALSIASSGRIACIGPVTARTAQDYGLGVNLVADDYTISGLVSSLTEKLAL